MKAGELGSWQCLETIVVEITLSGGIPLASAIAFTTGSMSATAWFGQQSIENRRSWDRFDLDRPGQDGYCHLTLADIDTGTALQKLFHTNSCSAERRSQRNINELCLSGL